MPPGALTDGQLTVARSAFDVDCEPRSAIAGAQDGNAITASGEEINHGLLSVGSPAVLDDHGRLRLWIEGTVAGEAGVSIYELENVAAPFGSP